MCEEAVADDFSGCEALLEGDFFSVELYEAIDERGVAEVEDFWWLVF